MNISKKFLTDLLTTNANNLFTDTMAYTMSVMLDHHTGSKTVYHAINNMYDLIGEWLYLHNRYRKTQLKESSGTMNAYTVRFQQKRDSITVLLEKSNVEPTMRNYAIGKVRHKVELLLFHAHKEHTLDQVLTIPADMDYHTYLETSVIFKKEESQ